MGGCQHPARVNTIDFITIATTGNATDLGDTTQIISKNGGASNSTRGLSAGGQSSGPSNENNTIEFIEISTTGNAVDFGDLTATVYGKAEGAFSKSRALFGGGYDGAGINNIDSVEIGSLGNAIDFGDLKTDLIGMQQEQII